MSRQAHHPSKTVNLHNHHNNVGKKNIHGVVPRRHKQEFSVKIWAGVFGECLLRPSVLPFRLKGQSYTAFFANRLRASGICPIDDPPNSVLDAQWSLASLVSVSMLPSF